MSDKQIKDVLEALDVVQKTIDENEKLSVLEKDKIEKANEAFTTKIENIQKENMKKESETKARIEALELELAKKENGEKVEVKEYENQLKLYMRKTGYDPSQENIEKVAKLYVEGKISGVTKEEKDAFTKALVEGSNPAGGYLIVPDRSNTILTRLFETSPMRQICTVVNTASNEMEFVLDDDEFGAGRVGEVSSRPETTTAQLALVKIPVHEYYANPYASQRMLDDVGFNLESWILNKGQDRISRLQNADFVSGSGATSPKGILSYSAWSVAGTYERNAIEQRNSGTSGDFDGDDLIDLQSDLHEDYQSNAKWLMTRKSLGHISKLKDSQGVYLFDRSAFLANGMKPVVLGKEVVIAADMQEIAADSLSVAYGDFTRGYTIVDRLGIRILRDPYSAKPYVTFYMNKRTGGAVTNFEAIKLLKLSV